MTNNFTITSIQTFRNEYEISFLLNFKLDGKDYDVAINGEPIEFVSLYENEGLGTLTPFENLPENVRLSLEALQNHLDYLDTNFR